MLRLLAFLVPLVILWILFPGMPWVAAVMATAIGTSLSIIFLRGPRDEVSSRLYDARQKRAKVTDADVEDAVTDALGTDAAADSSDQTGQPQNDQNNPAP